MIRPRQALLLMGLLFSGGFLTLLVLRNNLRYDLLKPLNVYPEEPKEAKPTPKYKPTPSYTPPPIQDPFPALATSTPPPIPSYNVAEKDVWKKYGLEVAPPLIIGFTRSWPMLLQAVVSYITAGWPAEQIYVVENTGMQQANTRGQLSLQHPWFLNHSSLRSLGVNIVQTPVLLSFAQLQNFYLSMSYANNWYVFPGSTNSLSYALTKCVKGPTISGATWMCLRWVTRMGSKV